MMTPDPRERGTGVNRPQPDLSPAVPHVIEVDIEELMLHGFEPGGCSSIAEAVEQELARVLGERGIPPCLVRRGDIARSDGGSFDIQPGSRPETIGRQVARAVYEQWLATGNVPR